MTGLFLEAERLILPDSVQKAQWKQMVERFTSLDAETFLRDFTGQLIWVVLKIGVAIAIYAVGRWVIRRIVHLMDASFDRRQVDRSLQSFLRSLLKGAAYTLLLLIIVQLLGFNTTSLVALLAASGFGIGMALSGTLQNFAGGVMVMFMHPYRIGDYIEAQGQAGTVKEIRLFSTVVTTTDNKRIYIPNSSISNAIVNNYSSETMRRVDWKISLAYGDDVATAKRTMARHARIRRTGAPPARCAGRSLRGAVGAGRQFDQHGCAGVGAQRRLLGSLFRYERTVLQ